MVESLPGVPKIRPEEIIIVLPDQATLEARGRARSDRPVNAEHVLQYMLLPWEKWHLNNLTEVFYILEFISTLERYGLKPWFSCPS